MAVKEKTLNDLPKWAQALVGEEVLRGAHLWPSFEEPTPVSYDEFIANRNKEYWQTMGSITSAYAVKILGMNEKYPQYRKLYRSELETYKAIRWELARAIGKEITRIDRTIKDLYSK